MEKSESMANCLDKDGLLGSLFQQIIADLKNGTPLWEDLVSKATKLHGCLKNTIQAIVTFLETFQKIADLATNARGATKDIGTTLTRICLRQKAVEAKLKSFTNSIMDSLVLPLQDKLEEWKRSVVNLDKEYTKEYKRARSELKKSSTDTLRLQKKAKKECRRRFDLQKRVECSLRDVDDRRKVLEDIEKQALRTGLVEERSRFCLFVSYVKPVMDEEIAMLTELSHLQEVIDQLEKHSADPFTLPAASEQMIADLKLSDNFWQIQTPPTSPSSLGSRKSSICSINSMNSSSSNGSKSPSHGHPWHKSLFIQTNSSSNQSSERDKSNNSSPTDMNADSVSWPNSQETQQFQRAATAILNERPHTISAAYEKDHHRRSPLSVYTFQEPSNIDSTQPIYYSQQITHVSRRDSRNSIKPPLPKRLSSLERPNIPSKNIPGLTNVGVKVLPVHCDNNDNNRVQNYQKPIYSNMEELNNSKNKVLHNGSSKFLDNCDYDVLTDRICRRPMTPTTSLNCYDGDIIGGTLPRSPQSRASCCETLNNGNVYHYRTVADQMPQRPLSMIERRHIRANSIQNGRPPPPIRRTSSISSTVALKQNQSPGNSMEYLPPPSNFLFNDTIHVADTVKSLIDRNHVPASPNLLRKTNSYLNACHQSLPNIQQPQSSVPYTNNLNPNSTNTILKSFQQQAQQQKKTVYAKPSALQASPIFLRKFSNGGGTRSHSVERKSSTSSVSSSSSINSNVSADFLASLNSKLSSPKSSKLQDDFHNKLKIKYNCDSKINRIRQLIHSKVQGDPNQCRESLMDQIKRGTRLKKVRIANDRSAPKMF